MKLRRDGSVQSSNVPTYANTGKVDNTKIYRCLVTKVTLASDPQNWTYESKAPRTLYDVVTIGGFESGQRISNCRFISPLAGVGAYFERILKPCTKPIAGTSLSDQDGDIVFVQFIQGQTLFPVITGVDNDKDNPNPILSQDTDPRVSWLYNGVYFGIDGKGLVTTQVGFTKDDFPSFSSTINPETEEYIREYKSGLRIVENGANDVVTVFTKGGTVATIDGQSNKVQFDANGTSIIIDGNSGKISISGATIDLGSAVSDMVTMFSELSSWAATHTHLVPQAPAGVTMSNPPVAPLTPTAASASVKVQS